MPRAHADRLPGGDRSHVLNRAAGRRQLFDHDGDYEAFLRTLAEALGRPRIPPPAGTTGLQARPLPVRVLGFCLMPNHWHLVLWPRGNGDLSSLMFWLTMTHTQRWRHFRGLVGEETILPRPIQVLPGPGGGTRGRGRTLPHGLPVRRTEPAAGGVSRAGRGLAVF